jgi:hypothetical protein
MLDTDDGLVTILLFLCADDVAMCRSVCRHWRSLTDGDSLWRAQCEREFGPEIGRRLARPREVSGRVCVCVWGGVLSNPAGGQGSGQAWEVCTMYNLAFWWWIQARMYTRGSIALMDLE